MMEILYVGYKVGYREERRAVNLLFIDVVRWQILRILSPR